jgi:hypothetical protein
VRRTCFPITMAMLLLLAPLGTGAGEPTPAAAGKAAAEAAAPARKVLVVARVKEEDRRRQLEGKTRAELQKRGVEALLGSDVMTEEDFVSEETIRKKVESLGVDGVLGFVLLRVDESVKQSSMSLSVGIGGYSGGGMGVMVGGTVPLGGSTTVVHHVQVRARYFTRPFTGPAWEKLYKEKVYEDTTNITQDLAYDSVKSLKKMKLIPAK